MAYQDVFQPVAMSADGNGEVGGASRRGWTQFQPRTWESIQFIQGGTRFRMQVFYHAGHYVADPGRSNPVREFPTLVEAQDYCAGVSRMLRYKREWTAGDIARMTRSG